MNFNLQFMVNGVVVAMSVFIKMVKFKSIGIKFIKENFWLEFDVENS